MNSNRLVCLAPTALVIVPSPLRWEQEYRMKPGVLLVALPLIALPLLMAQNGAVIEGTASNKITDAGVPGVTITLAASSSPDKQLYIARSDAAGAFRIEGVQDGDYVASFDAPRGFAAPERWDPWCKPFHVAAGGGPTKLQIPVIPLGSVRGRVVDADRHPVARVRVELFMVHYHGGDIKTTDTEGRFFMDGLMPGAYQLRARPALAGTPLGRRPEGLSPLPAKPPEQSSEGERWIWAPTYFPNAIEISAAMTIGVQAGSELAGYEIRLRSAPVYRLRGVVLNDEGKPAVGVQLTLLSEIGWATAEAQVKSGEEGIFEFPSVRSGRWQVTAETMRGKIKWMGFTELTMPRHDMEDAMVRIAPPFTLDGVVEGTPPAAHLSLHLRPAENGEESGASLQADGTLHFEDVYPGVYRIGGFMEIPGHYLKAILLGAEDVTGKSVHLAPGSAPLRVIFKSNAARVRGTVENGAGVKVVLIEADRERAIDGESMRAAVCDAEGHFTIESLRPTVYYAFAFAIQNVSSGAIEELVFGARGLGRQAKTLDLSEGETATLDLKVTPWPE